MMKALILTAMIAAGASQADTVQPSSTTATYGNWVVSCNVAGGDAGQVCETTTHLSVKGQDGGMHPLLQVAIGMPPGSAAVRIVVQVPGDVALRAPVRLSLDQTPPVAGSSAPVPQDDLVTASYFTCQPVGCLADADLAAGALARLLAAKSANVTFTAISGAKQIVVPVSLDGFSDAVAALGLAK